MLVKAQCHLLTCIYIPVLTYPSMRLYPHFMPQFVIVDLVLSVRVMYLYHMMPTVTTQKEHNDALPRSHEG
jgi:hypothetical protein